MKFQVIKASDYDYESEIEIETLEELQKFVESCDEKIVISRDFERITIYDSYLE